MAHEHRDIRKVIDAFEVLKRESVKDDWSGDVLIDHYVPDILDDYFEEQKKLFDLNKTIDLRYMLEEFKDFKRDSMPQYICGDDDETFGCFVPDIITNYFEKLADILNEMEGK